MVLKYYRRWKNEIKKDKMRELMEIEGVFITDWIITLVRI